MKSVAKQAEDEYFAKQEIERKKQRDLERKKNLLKDFEDGLKRAHYMCCPKCGHKLVEMDYQNIKIDKCSKCEGIWLDQGELELLSKKKNVSDSISAMIQLGLEYATKAKCDIKEKLKKGKK